MVDKLNKDLETISKEADYYRTMYIKYKQMYNDLLFHDIETKDPKPRDPTSLQNLLIYEAGVEDGKVSAGQYNSNNDKSQSKLELAEPIEVKVKVNNMQEFLDIWDVLYPQK
jgi:hypothetical protein